jgi:lysozyme
MSTPDRPPVKRTLAAVVGTAAAAMLISAVPKFEGTVLTAAPDPVGIVTACNGETQNVHLGQHFTLAQCAARLDPRLAEYAEGVDRCTPLMDRTPLQRVAIVDFAYNEGVSAYCGSSIAANFRAGNVASACRSFNESPKGKPQWVYAGDNQALPGLVKRRAKERAWCEGKNP